MANAGQEPIWSKGFISIAVANLFLFLVFFAHLTTLPIYAVDILQRSTGEAGLVVTVFLLASLIFTPISGKILEFYGKKNVLVICTILFLLSTLFYIWIENFSQLLVLRFLHGVWFSIATTATGAIAADIVPFQRRGEGLGYFAMSMNVAVVVGPFLALTLLQISSFDVLFIVLTFVMIGGVVLAFIVKVPSVGKDAPIIKKSKLKFDDIIERNVLPIAVVGGFVAFCYSAVISYISIYAQQKGLMKTSGIYFLVSALAMLISRPFVGRLFDTKGPNIVVYPAFIFFSAGLCVLSYTESSFSLLFSGVLIGLGYGSLLPCLQALAIQSVTRERSEFATATFYTFFDGGLALGTFILGFVASYIGYENLYLLNSLFVVMTIFIYKYVRYKKSASEEGLKNFDH